jgi:hypothetical protein
MGHYEKSKIYLIKNRNDEDKVYVGSTIRDLHTRFMEHKSKYINFNKNKSKKNYIRVLNAGTTGILNYLRTTPVIIKRNCLKKKRK